ncbi:MAG: helix-turn-helix domain-containing protein [Sphingobium sp.]
MSRSSPGVRRVVSILNFIADHPGQSFTLTDIVRALRLSRATCHSLLGGLVEAGYLFRSSDKSYVLGPALIAMGEVALSNFSPAQVARPEVRALADRYDAVCALCTLEDGDAVIVERAAALSHVGQATVRGARLPLLPQFAGIFFVRSSAADIAAWLDGRDPLPRPDQREALAQGVEFVRSHGFGVSTRTHAPPVTVSSPDRQASIDMLDSTMQPLFAIDPQAEYLPGYIQAPVYDSRRLVAFVVALSGFTTPIKGEEIRAIGEDLRETGERLSSFIGRVPVPGL